MEKIDDIRNLIDTLSSAPVIVLGIVICVLFLICIFYADKYKYKKIIPPLLFFAVLSILIPVGLNVYSLLLPSNDPDIEEISESIEDLTVDQLRSYLGQMFIVGDSSSFDDHYKESNMYKLIRKHNVGGIIVNGTNLNFDSGSEEGNISSVMRFISDLNGYAFEQNEIPLFISVDHEGGNTSSLSSKSILSELPSPMMVSATRSKENAFTVGEISGVELEQLGVNVLFGPVLDVNTNDENDLIRDRSFGGSAQLVKDIANEYIKGVGESKILLVSKHFPGHGSTGEGFHTSGMPTSVQSLRGFDSALIPFRDVKTQGIMTSHMRMKVGDEIFENVSLEPKIIKSLLRGKKSIFIQNREYEGLEFDGLVFTDDLTAPSATSVKLECKDNIEHYLERIFQVLVDSFEAGHDVFVFSNVLNHPYKIDNGCARSSVGLNEFSDLFGRFERYVFDEGHSERAESARKSIKKILSSKAGISHLLNFKQKNAEKLIKIKVNHKKEIEGVYLEGITILGNTDSISSFLSNQSDNKLLLVPFINKDYRQIEMIYSTLDRDGIYKELSEESKFSYEVGLKYSGDVDFHIEKNSIFYSEMNDRAKYFIDKVNDCIPDKIIFIVGSKRSWIFLQYLYLFYSDELPKEIMIVVRSNPTLLRAELVDAVNDLNVNSKKRNVIKRTNVYDGRLNKASIALLYSGYGMGERVFADSLLKGEKMNSESIPPIRIPYYYPDVSNYVH